MDFSTAENIAEALIMWAMRKGVTHYTHWFHPLTGSTAEKHDAFFKPSIDLEAKSIERLSASHYTHWFHPLTGSTAEKHDAFFKPSIDLEAKSIERQLRNS